jgi:undecaprenyl-diphosphatase
MEWWHAIVLGLVEGITEYLPVSSTGHLILASALLKLDSPAHKAAVDAFNIVVQGGAILAVLVLYWPRVVQMLKGAVGRDPAGLRLALNLAVAFIPAAIAGKLLHDRIEAKLFYPGPVVAALVLGGVFMIVLDRWRKGSFGRGVEGGAKYHGRELSVEDVTPVKAFFIGCMQCVALWPGTSRSMMSITGGMLAGLKPAAAAEFSFLLGLPTLGAACVYSLYKNVKHAHEVHGPNLFDELGWGPVILGIVVAAVSAAIAVRWLVEFLNRRGLEPFGWYRIVLGICVLGLIAGGLVTVKPEPKAETAPMMMTPKPAP